MGADLEGGGRRALDAEVDALAARFAAGPTRGLARIKKMIRESWGQALDEELDRQRDSMRELGFTDDYREGVAAFMEKRKPSFTGVVSLRGAQRRGDPMAG